MAPPMIPFLIAAGTVVSAAGQIQAGRAADKAARYEARQLERQSKREFAAGTREQAEIKRKGELLESNVRAQMAGSGGVTDDPGSVSTIGELGRDIEYNALAAMYDAASRAQGRRQQAHARRIEGANARAASQWSAMGTVLKGGSSYLDAKGT